ncbi:FAD-binding oxidoreductase [Bacillus paralicheniformis]|uniref:FAD-binding oxidoreductase n=1 Tax=Bacillus paralicheniformis TaxID=1648923 RepID=UPI00363ACB12
MGVELTGRVVIPDDPAYSKARINYNLNLSKYPGAIVFCQNETDIVNALQWARENEVPFRVRSGRHSYENFSLLNRGLVIDTSDMDEICVNVSDRTASIQAGSDLGHVYSTLWEHGMTIPAGTEFSVGLSGLTLGGGIGMLSRIFGLTCDNLLSLRIAVPEGRKGARIVEASRKKNRDLFWACCGGGGGNFGIVTEFTFRIYLISTVSLFRVEWGWGQLEEAFDAWQHWAPFTDHRLTAEIELYAKSQNQIVSDGQYLGPADELKQLLRPLLQHTDPKTVKIKTVPYIQAVDYFNNPAGNVPSFIKRSGSFIYEVLPQKAIQVMKHFLENAPNENATIWQQALGGAVKQIKPTETAYYHRKAIIAQEYNAKWTDRGEEERNVRWVESLRNALQPYTEGDYVNWPDLFIRNWPETYYGRNFHRLRKVKTEVDPFYVFRFEQSIPPL